MLAVQPLTRPVDNAGTHFFMIGVKPSIHAGRALALGRHLPSQAHAICSKELQVNKRNPIVSTEVIAQLSSQLVEQQK